MTLFLSIAHARELPQEIDDLLQSVEADGLPVAQLESKAREGVAKGVPPARIIGVLEGMQGDLLAARELLALPESAPDQDEVLSAAAAALRAEVAPSTLRRLTHLPEQIRGPAIQGMVDLMQVGFSEAQSAQLVEEAAAAGRPDEALSSLTVASSTLLVQGSSHVDVLQRITAELAAGQSSLVALSQGNNGNGNGNSGNGNSGNGNGNGNNGNSGNGNNGNGNGNSGNNGNGN